MYEDQIYEEWDVGFEKSIHHLYKLYSSKDFKNTHNCKY